MSELHELVVLATSLVWFAGATPEKWLHTEFKTIKVGICNCICNQN